MGNRSVTSYDVARRAGVSQSTVSRALRDDPRVVEKTRLRIRALAKEMGYVPHVTALIDADLEGAALEASVAEHPGGPLTLQNPGDGPRTWFVVSLDHLEDR